MTKHFTNTCGVRPFTSGVHRFSILLVAVLALLLNSCVSESIIPTPTPPVPEGYKTISLYITQAPEVRGQSRPIPDGELLWFNTGDLYLVNAAGFVVQHFRITESIANGGTEPSNFLAGGNIINRDEFGIFTQPDRTQTITLPNVPGSVTDVVIIGNTPHNAASGSIEVIGNRIIDVISQYNAWNVNLFSRNILPLAHTSGQYHTLPNGNVNRIYRGTWYLAPTVARLEINQIIGMGNIDGFTVAGIFVDNFHSRGHINGNRIAASLWSGGTDSDEFALGENYFVNNPAANPTSQWALFDLPNLPAVRNAEGSLVARLPQTGGTPDGSGSTTNHLWSYQVFAPRDTPLAAAYQPRIIIRLSNIRLINGIYITDSDEPYRYLTVRNFYNSAGNPFDGIIAGEVYHIDAVAFYERELGLVPNEP